MCARSNSPCQSVSRRPKIHKIQWLCAKVNSPNLQGRTVRFTTAPRFTRFNSCAQRSTVQTCARTAVRKKIPGRKHQLWSTNIQALKGTQNSGSNVFTSPVFSCGEERKLRISRLQNSPFAENDGGKLSPYGKSKGVWGLLHKCEIHKCREEREEK